MGPIDDRTRAKSAKELDIRFDSLWDRLRLAAEAAGYRAKDVPRLIASVRSAKR